MHVKTRDEDGNPCCPICSTGVGQAGAFCSETCRGHFVTVVSDQSEVIEMERYLDPLDESLIVWQD